MFRTNNDQTSALVWFALGSIVAIASLRYGLGTLDSPGTGFLPFLAGLAISLFSMIGLVHSTLKLKKGEGWKPVMQGLTWKKSLIVLGALFAYALLLKPLGFFFGHGPVHRFFIAGRAAPELAHRSGRGHLDGHRSLWDF